MELLGNRSRLVANETGRIALRIVDATKFHAPDAERNRQPNMEAGPYPGAVFHGPSAN